MVPGLLNGTTHMSIADLDKQTVYNWDRLRNHTESCCLETILTILKRNHFKIYIYSIIIKIVISGVGLSTSPAPFPSKDIFDLIQSKNQARMNRNYGSCLICVKKNCFFEKGNSPLTSKNISKFK